MTDFPDPLYLALIKPGIIFDNISTHQLSAPSAQEVFTITKKWRARWWQIPWLILRRQPWRMKWVYADCKITDMRFWTDYNGILNQVLTMTAGPEDNTSIEIVRPVSDGQDLQ